MCLHVLHVSAYCGHHQVNRASTITLLSVCYTFLHWPVFTHWNCTVHERCLRNALMLINALYIICIYIVLLSLILLRSVMSLLFCVARFLGGVRQWMFLFSVGLFLWSYVGVVVIRWPTGVWYIDFMFFFFPFHGLPLLGECAVCSNGCVGEVGCDKINSTEMANDRAKWWSFVNMVIFTLHKIR
jgi:hypothetical protein